MTVHTNLPPSANMAGPEAPPLGKMPISIVGAGRMLWPAVITIATGLVLIGLALYALLYLVRSVTAPEALAPRGNEWDAVISVVVIFAGVCTLCGLLAVGIGIVRFARISR